MINLPTDLSVIEINSNHTIVLWTRNTNDLTKLIGLLPYPMIEFLRTDEMSESGQLYYMTYAQFFVEYCSGGSKGDHFRPAISSVTIGEELENILDKSARYSSNCIPFAKWCSFGSKHRLFIDDEK
jgi:hypothetical protein